MKTIEQPADVRTRFLAFMKAFEAAPNDADIDIHVGQMAGGEPALVIVLAGDGHAFTTKEARVIAEIAEESMNACASDPRSVEFQNLILALRMGADKAERGLAHTAGEHR